MISLRKLLNEELVGEVNGNEVYKNPKSIKRMKPELRGISFPNGDLYVVDDARNIIHSEFFEWLGKKGHKVPSNMWSKPGVVEAIKKGYIPWQRKGSSESFYLSESTDFDDDFFDEAELMTYLKKYSAKVKQKNPKYKYVLKGVYK